MKKIRLLLAFAAFVLGAFGTWDPAEAQQSQVSPQTPAGMPALPLTPLTTQLGQTLQNLVGTPTGTATPNPLADKDEDSSAPIADTFATDALDALAKAVETLKANSTTLAADVSALPDFTEWLKRQSGDPHRQLLWEAIDNDLVIIVGAPLLVGVALSLFLLPVRLNVKRNAPATLAGRIGLLFGLFILRIVPAFAFVGMALLLLDQNESHRLPRFVIQNVIYAITLSYTIRQIIRGILAPTTPHVRLISFTTEQAFYAYRWFSAFTIIIVYGYFFIDVADALRVPDNAIVVFQNIFGLILTLMTITVIVQTRARVAAILRGADNDDAQSLTWALRVWLARHWHMLAIAYLIICFAVTVLGIDNGIALMLRGMILSFALLAGVRVAFVALDVWTTAPALIHRQILSFLLRPFIWGLAVFGIAEAWGFRIDGLLATPSGQRVCAIILSIALTLFVLTVLYEILNASIDRHLTRRDKVTKLPVASARARTLLPMVRNSVFILFSIIAVLVCLSAFGFNIAPLLAGAGVVGVAIGFGSQTLVKDFLTGLFIVVENTIAVGDFVKIDSFQGIVEALSIRTLRLRDYDGALHILPFSEVSKITNLTKGFAYALVDINVAYDSDLERVMNVLREIGAQIQEDPVFKRVIIEPIEVMGVEHIGDFAVTIRARIRTRPGKQWDVRRLLLLRIKQRFDKEKIVMPYPTTLNLTKTDGDSHSK